MKKYLVLGVLFILPITAYVFFASGVNNFGKLPVITPEVHELSNFTTLDGGPLQFKEHISVLGFFGSNPQTSKANAFNLTHKIYKKNRQFADFQFVILVPKGTEEAAFALKEKLNEIEDAKNWRFAFGTPQAINQVFVSLKTNLTLDQTQATPFVFIIDKEGSLRGRDEDEDVEVLYGFDARSIAEINNKMSDDIKVVLAEYRLELKKYKSKREI
ncbi:MAG: hypothetical protein ACI86C_000480 [Candidatus Latescibacterota bacterium]|jgi:hypothetical protein